jgi:hypothetical protein
MKLDGLSRRLDVLESALGQLCPHCRASEALSEEERDARVQILASGQDAPELPEPSPTCPDCQRRQRECVGMSEAELDVRIARLQDIWRKAI